MGNGLWTLLTLINVGPISWLSWMVLLVCRIPFLESVDLNIFLGIQGGCGTLGPKA